MLKARAVATMGGFAAVQCGCVAYIVRHPRPETLMGRVLSVRISRCRTRMIIDDDIFQCHWTPYGGMALLEELRTYATSKRKNQR